MRISWNNYLTKFRQSRDELKYTILIKETMMTGIRLTNYIFRAECTNLYVDCGNEKMYWEAVS